MGLKYQTGNRMGNVLLSVHGGGRHRKLIFPSGSPMITLVASGESVLKIGSLERLRGVAALFTVGAHLASYSSVDSTWFALTSRGWAGVDLFFVISGCVVTLSLSRKTGFSGWLLFLVRRFFRIFPMAFVAVVLTCASTWWVALVWHGAIDLASFHE